MEGNLLDHILVIAHLSEAVAAAEAAAKWEGRFFHVAASRWVRHTEWAVDSTAVLSLFLDVPALIVASLAEVCRSEAMEQRH